MIRTNGRAPEQSAAGLTEEILGKARSLVPILAEREADCVAQRDVSVATIDDFKRLGLMNLIIPKRFGGREIPFGLFSRAVEELAAGCASSAWVFSVLNEHAWIVACFEERAQLDVWGEDPTALAASGLAPRATAQRADGGWLLNGTWPFASGSTHAGWLLVGAFCAEADGSKPVRAMLVPKSDAETIEDWDVLGMRGTGSRSFALHDVFVPDYRTILNTDLYNGTPPGRSVHPDYALLRAPRGLFAPFSQPPVMIALARRALDIVAPVTGDRVSLGVFAMGKSEYVQVKIAEAAAEVRAAHLLMQHARDEGDALLAGGGPITNADSTRIRCDIVLAQRMARTAVDVLAELAGAKLVYDTHPLQPVLRDVLVTATHLAASWQHAMAQNGAVMLGADPLVTYGEKE